MGLLDGLEKLINEHGSATILRERIALAEDKYSSLEAKAKSFEIKVADLETENKTLKSNLEEAEKEIDRLNKIIQTSQEDQGIKKLKEIEEQILKLFFETNQEFYAANIASRFNINIGVAEYHINNLLKLGLISASYNMMDDTCYYINTNGRAHVVGNTP